MKPSSNFWGDKLSHVSQFILTVDANLLGRLWHQLDQLLDLFCVNIRTSNVIVKT